MMRWIPTVWMMAGLAGSAGAQEMNGTAPGAVAFVDVNVVTMEGDRVDEGVTVVVRGGTIETVGPAESTPVPHDVLRVEGEGRWLMPGLAEMHAHIPGGDAPEQLIEDIFFLYVANGVTTIRGMLGAPNQLELRERTASGDLLGPTIYVGAPSLNGNSAPEPEIADSLVRAHAANGYDLLKIHPGLSRATWDRIVAVSDQVGLTMAGHIPQAVGLDYALETGMEGIDHLDGYVSATFSEAVKERLAAGEPVPPAEALATVTDESVRSVVERTLAAGTYNTPTAYLWENLYRRPDPEAMTELPEMRYAPAQMKAQWRQMGSAPPPIADPETTEAWLDLRRRILVELADAGAPILMGTDTPQMYNVPGFALMREIRLMEEAGMTPLQILRSGTTTVSRYAGEVLGLDDAFGRVAPGQRADLVLLRGNPLESLDHLDERDGVMVRGRWIPAAEIEAGLRAIEARNAG